MPQSGVSGWLIEFVVFGLKQAWTCLFGGLMLAAMIATHYLWPAGSALARYDFLFLAALSFQVAMLAFKLEKPEEAKVILIFHVVGTVMELFKTHAGSWVYPDPSVLRIGGVPLFSGFMYAAVGSYIARVTRIFDMRYTGYPDFWQPPALALAIYANFFTHHFAADMRLALFAATAWIFRHTFVHFRVLRFRRRMPLVVGFGLVALFIWIAENIATHSRAWLYPGQVQAWSLVPLSKLGAWYLLMIISFVLVTLVHRPKTPE